MADDNRSVLVIDDDDVIVEAAAEYLTRYGYDVHKAREFSSATSLMMGRNFDVVLMDLHLTGGSTGEGLQMVRWIRDQFPRTRVGVTTASTSNAVLDLVRELGVSVFVSKPANLKNVLMAVQSLNAAAGGVSPAGGR